MSLGPMVLGAALDDACDDLETNPPTIEPTAVYVGGKGDVYADADDCVITLCLTGALQHETPSNTHFRELCEDPRIQGVKFDCHGEVCNSTFDSFLQFPLLSVYPALSTLWTSIETVWSRDGSLCEVNLIGFSWAGSTRSRGRTHSPVTDESPRVIAAYAARFSGCFPAAFVPAHEGTLHRRLRAVSAPQRGPRRRLFARLPVGALPGLRTHLRPGTAVHGLRLLGGLGHPVRGPLGLFR